MTHGLAILCMLCLHLFCRLGADVYGTPLVWLSTDKPLVYCFGFFAEICVPIYTICAGYAQYLLWEQGKFTLRERIRRCLKLLKTYWIVVILLSIFGLLASRGEVKCFSENQIPGSWSVFIKTLLLLHLYTGIWWYLRTYVILLLLPHWISTVPVQKVPCIAGVLGSLFLARVWWLLFRFDWLTLSDKDATVLSFLWRQFVKLCDVLPYFWIGGFLCKGKCIEKIDAFIDKQKYSKHRVWLGCLLILLLFLIANILHKAILMGGIALLVFLAFNLMPKGNIFRTFFMFLGKHSTNIWLIHPFFYAERFGALVRFAKYPVCIFIILFVFCIIFSYIINGCLYLLNKFLVRLRQKCNLIS